MDICESVRVRKSEDVSKTCADVRRPVTQLSEAAAGGASDTRPYPVLSRSNKKKSKTGCLFKRYEQCGGT